MKSALFDTSVIIAATFKNHPHFSQAFHWISAIKKRKIDSFISAHCLAELYSNLTRLQYDPILSPSLCIQIIQESVIPKLKPIDLSIKDYRMALNRVAERGLRGGIVYDSLHLQAALKKKVDLLVTLNVKDFERLIEPGEIEIVNPLSVKP